MELGFQSLNSVSDTETAQGPRHDQYHSLSRLTLSRTACEKASPFSIDFDEVPAISGKTSCQHARKPVLQRGRLQNKSILFGEGEANLSPGKMMVGLQLLRHVCRHARAYLPTPAQETAQGNTQITLVKQLLFTQ